MYADDARAAAFGQRLFFEKGYSKALTVAGTGLGNVGDVGKVACASCHDPLNFYSDSRSRPASTSVGVNWTQRNSPSLVNAACYKWGLGRQGRQPVVPGRERIRELAELRGQPAPLRARGVPEVSQRLRRDLPDPDGSGARSDASERVPPRARSAASDCSSARPRASTATRVRRSATRASTTRACRRPWSARRRRSIRVVSTICRARCQTRSMARASTAMIRSQA
ncbi:MAG: hypothetical protein H0T46_27940 [Deltaproteobacteria bacterium]|nr:hypothetical protein [Deltaproteobacteria bacterium]